MQALAIPFGALVFGLVALREWQRMPLCARIALGAATAMVLTAAQFPGLGTDAVLEQTGDGMTYVFAFGRMVGLACALTSAYVIVRETLSPS